MPIALLFGAQIGWIWSLIVLLLREVTSELEEVGAEDVAPEWANSILILPGVRQLMDEPTRESAAIA